MSDLRGRRTEGNRDGLSHGSGKRQRRRNFGFLALEPRVMYDGAAAATAASTDHHADAATAAAPAGAGVAVVSEAAPPPAPAAYQPPPQQSADRTAPTETVPKDVTPARADDARTTAPKEVVFVDADVPDLSTLLAGLRDGQEVHVLDPAKDGLQQIADYLHDHDLHDLTAIQIISHGREGVLSLGATELTEANMAFRADTLAQIGASLTADGDILLYGCDIGAGAGGSQFLSTLSQLTGADVAASTGTTGATGLGGDWVLEKSTGSIEVASALTAAGEAAWTHLLPESLSATMTITLKPGGGDVDGDGVVDPGDTVTTTVTISNDSTLGTDAAMVQYVQSMLDGLTYVPGSLRITPIGFNDSYAGLVGNTPVSVDAAHGVLFNDRDVDAATPWSNIGLSVDTTIGATNVVGGSVQINADGSFVFTPSAGATTAHFDYLVRDATNLDSVTTATVTLNFSSMIWYVNSAAASGGDGTYDHPFNTMMPLNGTANNGSTSGDVDGSGDTIFVYNKGASYGNITLEANQTLLGDGASLTANNLVIADGTVGNTAFNTSGASLITLGMNNTIKGVTLLNGTSDIRDNGSGFGTLTIDHVSINNNSGGRALNLTNGSFAAGSAFTSITSDGGLSLTNVGGSVDLGTGSLSGDAGGAFVVSGGTVSTTYSGNVTDNSGYAVDIDNHDSGTIKFQTGTLTSSGSGALGIRVQNSNGGVIEFDNPTIKLDTQTHTAIDLGNNNGSGTVNFRPASGGNGLDITTTSGVGFLAGAGTLVLTGAGNTIQTATGRILDWSGTTLGTDGVAFNALRSTSTVTGNAISLANLLGTGMFNGGSVIIGGATGVGVSITGSGQTFQFTSAIVDNTSSNAISLSGANGAVSFNTVTLDFIGGDGIFILGNTNAVSILGGTIGATDDPAGNAIRISGGSADVTIAASATKTTGGGKVVNVASRTGGTVALSGNLAASGGFDNGIGIVNNSGGTINLTGPTQSLSTAANTAVLLSSNTGVTINFAPGSSGQGLDIVTTSGLGFSAVGGGTVTVQGAGNTITSTTGTALNIVSTTIGAAGVTFQSISSNGAPSGIILNSTGSSGGLSVTGDNTGLANGSGGTINASSGPGVSLTNTRNVSLDQMNVQNGGDDGIRATNVINFNLTDANVTSNGNAIGEHGLDFAEVTGTIAIADTTVRGSFQDNFRLANTTGTIDVLNITDSTFDQSSIPVSPAGGNGILVDLQGTAVLTKGSIRGTTFRNNFSNGILVNTNNNSRIGDDNETAASTNGFVVSGSTFDDNNIAIQFGVFGSSDLTVDIQNNTIINDQRTATSGANSTSQAITIGSSANALAGSTLNARIEGNIIGSAAIAGSGSSTGSGIRAIIQGLTDATILINNNTIRQAPVSFGIDVESLGSTSSGASVPVSDVTITNNDVNHVNTGFKPGTSDFPLPAIYVSGDNQGTAGELRVDVRGNTVPTGTSYNFTGGFIELYEYVGPNGFLELVDTGAVSPNASSQLTSTNTGSAVASSGVTLLPGGTSLTTPPDLSPLPLMALPSEAVSSPPEATPAQTPAASSEPDGASSGTVPTGSGTIGEQVATSIPTASSPSSTPDGVYVDDGLLSQAELDATLQAAIARWAATGLTADQVAALQSIKISVADLTGNYLGRYSADGIVLDNDAAGLGWFIDTTPMSDSEFAHTSDGRLLATSGDAPAGKIDLLTTLMHELGHELGLGDAYASVARASVMYGFLPTGERRLPTYGEAVTAVAGSIQSDEYATAPTTPVIPTLPAGKKVSLIWDSTVDAQSPGLVHDLQNQGTVSSGTFATVNTDGAPAAGVQPTTTQIDSLTLGGTIWYDNGAGGGIAGNGVMDGAEGYNGAHGAATLHVYVDNGDGVFGAGDTQVMDSSGLNPLTATTDANGNYKFAGLAAGNYIVVIDSSNFTAGTGALRDFSGTSPAVAADPNLNVDSDNDGYDPNGAPLAGGPVVTKAIRLDYNQEPVTDGDADADTNLTLDFGFITNLPPTIDNLAGDTLAFTEGDGALLIDQSTAASVTDSDSANFNGGSLTVTVAGALVEDALSIIPNDVILLVGNTVRYDADGAGIGAAVDIGTLSGGANGVPLVISFNTNDATPAAVSALLTRIAYQNTNGDNPNATTRTVNVAVDDGDGGTTTVSASVQITAVNDAPMNAVPGSQAVDEDTNLVFSSGNGNAISISDVDIASGNAQVTLTVANGTVTLSQITGLAFTTGDGTADASMVFSGTLANINAALAGLTYRANQDYNGSDTLTLTTSDLGNSGTGGAQTDTDSVAITVSPVNDAPVDAVPGPQAVNEDTNLVFSTANGNAISISDVDIASGNAEVTLTVANGTLTLSQIAGLAFTAGDGAADAAMTFTGTLADINAALAGLTYRANPDYNGSDTVTLTTSDLGNSGTGGAKTDTDTVAITVNPVNDAPSFTKGGDQTVNEDAGPQTVSGWATGISAGPANESGQTLTFTVTNDNNALFSSQPTIDASGNLTYTSAANANGTATVTVVLHDNGGTANGGVDTSVTQTFTITVDAVNDAPVNAVPGLQTVAEDSNLVFSTGNGNAISISDVDIASGNAEVTLTVANGTLTLSQTTGLAFTTGDGTADAAMTFTGTLADINAALAGLTYRANQDYNGSDTLTLTTNDQGNNGAGGAKSATDTVAITINPVNDAPVNAVPGPQAVNEDTNLVFSSANGNALSVSDVDIASGSAQVTLTATNGLLTLSQTSGLTFAIGDGTANVTMTFTGTLSAVNAALDGLTYRANPDYNGPALLQITTSDQGNSGAGGAQTDTDTVAITVNPVNDAPSFTTGGDQTVNEDAGPQTVVGWATGISAGPANESGQTLTFTVTNDNNALFSVQPTLDASGNLAYTSAANANGTATVTVVLHDNGGTANGGVDTSVTQTFTITVNPVNDAPVNAVPGLQTVAEDSNLVFSTGNGNPISISDVDIGSGNAEVTLAVGNGVLTLSQTSGLAFTTGDGTADATMTFSGTLADVNAALAGLTYRANQDYSGADILMLTTSDLGNSGAGGAQTATDTVVITVSAVNDAPVNAVPGPQAVNEDSNLVFSSGNGNAISISDVDIASGNAEVTLTVANGVLTLSQTTGLVFTTGDGTGDATMTFSGTLANVNAALAGLIYRAGQDYNGTDALTLSTSDLGNSGSGGPQTDTDTVAITVNPINDAPAFAKGADQAVNEDAGPQTVNGWATGISAGPANESGQTLAFTVTNDNNALFSAQPTIDANGNLTYTSAANANGTATVTVVLHDNGGTANGGVDTSVTQTFTITVNPVNDAPVNAVPGPQTVNEDTNLVFSSVNGNALSVSDVDLGGGTLQVSLRVFNGVLTLSQTTGLAFTTGDGTADDVMLFTGTAADINAALNGLTYRANANFNGAEALGLVTNDQGNSGADPGLTGDGASEQAESTVLITVNPVNDAPSFTKGANQTANEDAGPQTVNGWATGLSKGPANESGQTLNFVVTNDNNALFSVQPTIDANGNLTYTSAANANGIATVTVVLHDNGGTANGGVDTSTTQTFTIMVNPVNDAPELSPGNIAFYNANTPGPVPVFPDIAVTDIDSTALTGATVAISFGKQFGDALHFTNQGGITGSYNATTGVLTLSGNASLAAYQAALRSITFSSTTNQPLGARTITWVVNDGSAQNNLSDPATTLMAVIGRVDHHHYGDYGFPGNGGFGGPFQYGSSDRYITYDPASISFPQGYAQGSSIGFVRADAGLTINADRSYEIALPLASIAASLGGDIAFLSVSLADGKPLPDWLVFDASTGKFAGRLPDGMVASLGPEPGPGEVVTGALPPAAAANDSAAPATAGSGETLKVQVVARDFQGNISIMTFTIVLQPVRQGSNMPSQDTAAHDNAAADAMRADNVIALPAEKTAWSLDRDAWTRAAASGSAAALVAAVDKGSPAALAGRASLGQQIERAGWRSMSADRTALLHSLREGTGTWR